MAVAELYGVPVAVTAGMGGISSYIQGETLCPDLPALVESKTILIATSPKDVVDIQSSIDWLLKHQVKILGARYDYCSGFMFAGKKIPLSGILKKRSCSKTAHSDFTGYQRRGTNRRQGYSAAGIGCRDEDSGKGRVFSPGSQ